LGFAAHHIEQGAHRLYLYLDAPDDTIAGALNAHPKVRVTQTDDRYWARKGKRPAKHQPRQTLNAADAYAKRAEVDWLAHIDVDEFLVPRAGAQPLAAQLAALPGTCLCARVRPIEALAHVDAEAAPRPFKGLALDHARRSEISARLFAPYGVDLNGGFLSHVAGKMLYRTGVDGLSVKIHNAFQTAAQGEIMNPGQIEMDDLQLCHTHGADWDTWIAQFRYRHEHGAYRAELKGAQGKPSMHTLLERIRTEQGTDGLRHFWETLCTPRPARPER